MTTTGAEMSTRVMARLQAIDSTATVAFSSHTGKWYVDTRLEVGDGMILSGVTEHRDSPGDALWATFARLRAVEEPQYIVGHYLGRRREYRWNGEVWAECTRPEAMQPLPDA